MSQREWFATALRVLGVMKLIESIDDCITAYDISARLFTPQSTTVGGAMNHAIGMALIGLVLVIGAPFLSGLVVGASRKPAISSGE